MGPTTEGKVICTVCLTSISDRTPVEWFRWLKRNDPAHWELLVEHNRLGYGEVSDLIRRIRIE